MPSKRTGFLEVEKLLQDLGAKIEELIEKGKAVSGDAGMEVDRKIAELKLKKEELERDFHHRKATFDKEYSFKKKIIAPKLKKSGENLREAFRQFKEALQIFFGPKR